MNHPRLSLGLPLLALFACGQQTSLADTITRIDEIPDGSDYDNRLPSDPAYTGIAISPGVAHVLGPSRLLVRNDTSEAQRCEVYEEDYCPSLGDLFDPLLELAPGETWQISGVSCTLLDIACLPASGDGTTLPTRTWGWFVEPPSDL